MQTCLRFLENCIGVVLYLRVVGGIFNNLQLKDFVMKNVFIITLFSFCSHYLPAQSDPQLKPDPKNDNQDLQKHKPAQLTFEQLALLQPLADTARYSHTTAKGNIYHLSPDNMPCLRPDTSAYYYNQPQRKIQLKGMHPKRYNMPNALGAKPLVWEKKP